MTWYICSWVVERALWLWVTPVTREPRPCLFPIPSPALFAALESVMFPSTDPGLALTMVQVPGGYFWAQGGPCSLQGGGGHRSRGTQNEVMSSKLKLVGHRGILSLPESVL